MSKEFVRERVLRYLMEDLYVPQDMIETNVPLSEFEEDAEGIVDIIVSVKDKDEYYVPVLVVICLDEDFVMEGEALNKQLDYAEYVDSITTSGKMILTNGNDMMYLNCEQEYDEKDPLPTYDQMVADLERIEKLVEEEEMAHAHDCDCGCHDHDHHNHDCDCDCGCHDHE